MNNKGFIATSLVYSFFLVFVAVMASILATYAHNRILVNNLNDGIVDDLNESVENKYSVIKNILKNSDFEESGDWIFTNASITVVPNPLPSDFHVIAYSGMKSLAINMGDSEIKQSDISLEKDHYYYLRYYYFRNGPFSGTRSSRTTLEGPGLPTVDFGLDFTKVSSLSDENENELYANWVPRTKIMQVTQDGNYELKITNTDIAGEFANLNIDSIMLIDVTELIPDGVNVSDYIKDDGEFMKFLNSLDYFEGAKSIAKP